MFLYSTRHYLEMEIEKKLIVFMLFLTIVSPIVFAEIISPNQERTCTGGKCTETIHGSSQFYNDAGTWKNISDYTSLTFTADGFNISYGKQEIIFDPVVNYSGTIYSWSSLPAIVKSFAVKKFESTKYPSRYKWTFNLSVPVSIQNVGFNITRNTTPISISGLSVTTQDGLLVDFSDIVQSTNYTVSNSGSIIWISNLKGDLKIYLDPIVTINAGNSTGNGTSKAFKGGSSNDPPTAVDAGTEYSTT